MEKCRNSRQRRETPLALWRLIELQHRPILGNFDVAHLQAIHRYLFQDVYNESAEEFLDLFVLLSGQIELTAIYLITHPREKRPAGVIGFGCPNEVMEQISIYRYQIP